MQVTPRFAGEHCTICLEEWKLEGNKCLALRCGHLYHTHCVKQHIDVHRSCPLCRSAVNLTQTEQPKTTKSIVCESLFVTAIAVAVVVSTMLIVAGVNGLLRFSEPNSCPADEVYLRKHHLQVLSTAAKVATLSAGAFVCLYTGYMFLEREMHKRAIAQSSPFEINYKPVKPRKLKPTEID